MAELHFTTTIKGSPETIFDLIADLPHYDDWLPGSSAFGGITDISPLPVALGTTYVDAGPTGTRYGEVTVFVRPTRLDFHQPMKVKPYIARGTIDIHLRHTLTRDGDMTRLDRDLTLRPNVVMKLAQPIVVAQFRQENERMLSRLKAYVESKS